MSDGAAARTNRLCARSNGRRPPRYQTMTKGARLLDRHDFVTEASRSDPRVHARSLGRLPKDACSLPAPFGSVREGIESPDDPSAGTNLWSTAT